MFLIKISIRNILFKKIWRNTFETKKKNANAFIDNKNFLLKNISKIENFYQNLSKIN